MRIACDKVRKWPSETCHFLTLPLSHLLVALSLAAAAAHSSRAAPLTDPDVDRYNMHVGTQTFAGLYNFTTNTLLVETAEAIRAMGSDALKFYLGPDFSRQYRIE